MNIKDIVKDNTVRFNFYRKGELWYDVITPFAHGYGEDKVEEVIFSFSVPIEDTGDAAFLREDKAILFMRYIRKQLEENQKELDPFLGKPV